MTPTDRKWWCASGTWSHNAPPPDYDYYVLKTATLHPRVASHDRILRKLPEGGYLNRIGVPNPGLAAQLATLPKVPGKLVVSVLGFNREEWDMLATGCDKHAVPILELNLSCPNTEVEPVGTVVGAAYAAVVRARRAYGGRLGVKLPPTVGLDVARAAVDAGADYLTISNTLDTPLGGISGRPLRALALDAVQRIAPWVDCMIVGGGGITRRTRHEDGQAYIDAGATDLFQGTANLMQGYTPEAFNA